MLYEPHDNQKIHSLSSHPYVSPFMLVDVSPPMLLDVPHLRLGPIYVEPY